MMTLTSIFIPQDTIGEFCQRHQVRKLALFGSILRDDFRPDSDVDVLIEFEPDAHVGWEFVSLQDELSQILGRKVDLNTPDFLSRHFRQKVLDTAQVIYERT